MNEEILEFIKKGMIINASHQKGGTGKSTIIYHLARAFILLGYKVKLLDLDIQNTCVSLNELREEELDYILNITEEEEFVEIINNAAEDEIILIDSGGFDSTLTRLAIMAADINLTPVADKVTELLAVIRKYSVILEEIADSSNKEIKSYVLLNKIHLFATNFDHIIELLEDQERMQLITTTKEVDEEEIEVPFVIRDRNIYDKALTQGLTVQEAPERKGHEDASYEMEKLAKILLKINSEVN